jgi:G:T-mismatch repair DNA endonuclease (very short patch repair protein)
MAVIRGGRFSSSIMDWLRSAKPSGRMVRRWKCDALLWFERDGADESYGRPDRVLPRWEAATFVQGCFRRRQSPSRGRKIPLDRRLREDQE